ncbi:S-adenosyl-L-methionine-dependent methyltransferase [Suhomyces tanzawaensis NRRL Y-17324]|uniref:S-adenosyl-L-methionine-dependent methyltransferase n=1 Tax=Suhomyces tanzawaensis NRRL Y-17324 TaxID=984487 RepID=A0A1E4SN15_9ASCO|nr:S-adenosyl-L-methionine-dependent methyltransferase [Suhomyces tanzawaensis NRRL Y-17324]ODV80924.1 S-adenosyl-L-methionine-dependent methyltransferase [Suhomyces tanzawaensis NRRL Y-17324]
MSKQANSTAINSFNSNHKDYDQYRPSFAKSFVDPFLAELGLATKVPQSNTYKMDTSKVILELAAGTGKFTRNLVDNGWGNESDNLIIVEPSSGMLKSFKTNFPKIRPTNIHNASSYELPLADSSVDSVLIAQGFHWFSDQESLKEINRVLKPNGTLGLIWNFDYPSPSQNSKTKNVTYIEQQSGLLDKSKLDQNLNPEDVFLDYFNKAPWSNEISKKIYSYDVGVPQYRHGKWRGALELDREYFDPISGELFYAYEYLIDRDSIYEYWKTRSYITSLSEKEKIQVKEFIEGVVDKAEEISPKKEGKFVRPMATHAVVVPVKKA